MAIGSDQASISHTRVLKAGVVTLEVPQATDLRSLLARAGGFTRARYASGVLIAVILGLALWLRLTGVNWDDGRHLHPDERFLSFVTQDIAVPSGLGEYFDSSSSSMSPYNRGHGSFVYGTFPLFTTKIAGEALDEVEDAPVIEPVLSSLFDKSDGQDLNLSGYDGNLVGRALAGLFDVGTVLLVFFLGRRLYDRNVGLLAAFLLSVTVLHIQHAHFFVVESFVTFFSLLTIFYSVRIAQDGGWRNYALAGVALGFAVASKLSVLPLLGIVGLAAAINVWPALRSTGARLWQQLARARPSFRLWPESSDGADRYQAIGGALAGLAVVLLAAFLVFRIAQPYAFSGPHFWDVGISDIFRDDITRLRQQQEGGTDFPPAIQWIGRAPYLFALENMVVWGMGPALGIAAWAGVLYAGWRTIRHRENHHLLLLAWILGNFAYSAGQFVPAMRYLLPIYPQMVLLAAFALVTLWRADWTGLGQRFGRFYHVARPTLPVLAKGALVTTVVGTSFWGIAFTNVYRTPVSRIQAGEWLSSYVSSGDVIGSEHWDDSLPLTPEADAQVTKYEMTPFTKDSPEKIDKLIDDLDNVDFVTYTSNRAYGSLPQFPAQFPETVRYYDLMFAEELGFRLVGEFTVYPSFLGISIPDQGAEESFTVYDHPKVSIFEKTDDFSRERVDALLSQARADAAIHLAPKDAHTNALMLRPDELETQREGGTWTSIFDPDSVTNKLPLWTWLFVVQLISLAVLPATLLLFRGLPDRGYLLSKPLGFLVLGWLVWLSVSLKFVDFTRLTIGLGLVLMLIAGAAVAYAARADLLRFVRERWRSILLWEAIFLGAFVLFYIIRLNNPDLWHPVRGGEKPMDFAYLNAIIRSTTLPPIDPWFAGGYLNYYYFGQFLTAVMAKFTGVLPEVSYNLAVPLFFSLGVAATYSLVFNLAEGTRRFLRRRPRGGRIGPAGPIFAGFGAVLLVMVVGNLGGMRQLVDNFSAVSSWHVDTPVLGGAVGFLGGIVGLVFQGESLNLPTDWYWGPSRMMPPQISITEFPFFSFLFADLHAHMMAIPFSITSLAVGAGVVMNATRLMRESPRYRQWAGWGLVVVLALVIGALRWINSWDYPPFLIMGVAAVFIAERVLEGRLSLIMLGRAALKSGVLIVLSIAFFYPFLANYELPATGFQRMDFAGGGRETTAFHQYLAHFGVFLFLAGGFVAFTASRGIRKLGAASFMTRLALLFVAVVLLATVLVGTVGPIFDRAPIDFTVKGLSTGDFLRDTFAGIFEPLPGPRPIEASTDGEGVPHPTPVVAFALAGIALLGLLGWFALRRVRGDGAIRLFVFGMLALSLILTAGVDIAVLDPDIARMNTVFKFYLHAWVLLAVPAAFGAWYVVDVVRPRLSLQRSQAAEPSSAPAAAPAEAAGVPVFVPATARRRAPRRARGLRLSGLFVPAFAIAGVGFILAALVYPLFATPVRVRDRFNNPTAIQPRTGDGIAYMLGAEYGDGPIQLADDRAAIDWMRENVEGSPTIIEGTTPNYRWGSRFAINTGLPAVAAWDFHQVQQRGAILQASGRDLIAERRDEVSTFYSTLDGREAQYILEKYNVGYVVLGQLERNYYPAEGLAKIESGLGGMLRQVYRAGETRIFEVVRPQPALASGE